VALAVLFVAIGYVEYATRSLLLNPKVIASNQFETYFRVNSLFFDPNIYGRFLATVMLCLTAVLLWTRDRRTVVLSIVALAFLWGGLVLTLSQSSFTALLAGLLVLAALRWGLKPAAIAAGVALLVGVVVALAAPASWAWTATATTRRAGATTSSRAASSWPAGGRCRAGARARSAASTAGRRRRRASARPRRRTRSR
jgi:hypothetical protein